MSLHKTIILFTIICTILFPLSSTAQDKELQSIIIEVDGNPHQHKQYIENYHPFIEVVQVYDTLFNGLALRAKPGQLAKMERLDFVVNAYQVHIYQTQSINNSVPFLKQGDNSSESTSYTGKGVKIGVIDTGIDHTHPDLKPNYKGGYDLVDLDDDPMETLPEQGMPTIHGSHVAGIIAANGEMKGVAPEAELYGYRALGPGGMGTSIQVIAAIEKAVKDGMDIINMSLGNAVNGPDWPTSIAVNKAVALGVSIVIANGNSGPNNWTVGSPATSTDALSVGASTPPLNIPYLSDSFLDKKIYMSPLMGSTPWDLTKEYPVIDGGLGKEEIANARDKIVLMKRGEIPFAEKARIAEQAGAKAVIIYNNEAGSFQGSVDDGQSEINIPATTISKKDGEWLTNQIVKKDKWIDTKYQASQDKMADFSSRGPVTTNWKIKPEIVAPGAAITSTVPGGYMELQGTSMAAPHVAGGLALVKQAHPDWTPEQLKGALLTTALPLQKGEELYDPIIQGMGRMQPQKAIETTTIIHEPLLTLGKIEDLLENHTVKIEIENVSNHDLVYRFDLPKQTRGIRWHMPNSFKIGAKSKKTVAIEASINSSLLKNGLHQGWLTLKQQSQTYNLPYLLLNKEGDYPKAMGMEFSLRTFSDDQYQYRLYLPEKADKVTVDLYNPRTLAFERTLLELEDLKAGLVEGSMEKRNLGKTGKYLANVTVETADNKQHSYQTEIVIEFPE
ncbi:S8 family serine peptidase [Aquibacillus halophilus]|uniref:S8 family serine peptidase n=1 Tax=Aquibacillus halophilus TaxID=930132 RepID=A0A6A8DLU6_9BACI|nr:S8 family serine peptidase [Aquibacillus halophilus]MRH43967.1 S8 family serine peptidase [Aquibacillus halophilus]